MRAFLTLGTLLGSTAILIAQTAKVTSFASEKFLWVKITPQKPFHLYYQDPGEMGIPPKIRFHGDVLALQHSKTEFPLPKRFQTRELHCIGYESTFWLRTPYSKDLISEKKISATLSWLACSDDQCLPEEQEISFDLQKLYVPPKSQAWPAPLPKGCSAEINVSKNGSSSAWILTLTGFSSLPDQKSFQDIFTSQPNLLSPLGNVKITHSTENSISVLIPLSEYYEARNFTSPLFLSFQDSTFSIPSQKIID